MEAIFLPFWLSHRGSTKSCVQMAADISDYVGTGMGEEKGKAFSSWEQEGALLPACPPSSPWGERVPDAVSRHSLSSCSSCFCLCLEEQEKLRGQRKQEKSNTWLTAALKAAGSLPETPPKALRVLSPREEKNTKNKLLKHCPGEAFDPERKIDLEILKYLMTWYMLDWHIARSIFKDLWNFYICTQNFYKEWDNILRC